MSRYISQHLCTYLLVLVFLLSSCGSTPTPTLPTAYVVRSRAAATPVARTPIMPTPVTISLTIIPTSLISPTAIPTSLPSAVLDPPLDQYRAWMEEARAAHAYSEAVDVMWAVMICESSGRADEVAGSYSGLFQYDSATWAGDWNPYRASPILDPRAQIFATAKAWHDGHQHWWGCYR